MCKLKSAIILKDRIFIPDYNSHGEMLEELGIEDTKANAKRLFVRAELSPRDGDVFSPIDTWKFKVDQDILPEWFVASYEEQRMREAVKEWAKERIHVGIDGLKINVGINHYIKDCKDVEIYGYASISEVCGSTSIREVYGYANIGKVYDYASISKIGNSASIDKLYDYANIGEVYDSASIDKVHDYASISEVYDHVNIREVCDSASIGFVYRCASIGFVGDCASIREVGGSAIISSSRFGWKNKDKVILSDNATFKDREAKVIYQSGNWVLRLVERDGTIS